MKTVVFETTNMASSDSLSSFPDVASVTWLPGSVPFTSGLNWHPRKSSIKVWLVQCLNEWGTFERLLQLLLTLYFSKQIQNTLYFENCNVITFEIVDFNFVNDVNFANSSWRFFSTHWLSVWPNQRALLHKISNVCLVIGVVCLRTMCLFASKRTFSRYTDHKLCKSAVV